MNGGVLAKVLLTLRLGGGELFAGASFGLAK